MINKDSTSDLILELQQHQQKEKLWTNPEKAVGIEDIGRGGPNWQ